MNKINKNVNSRLFAETISQVILLKIALLRQAQHIAFLAMTRRIIFLAISHSYRFLHFRHCERSMSEAISYRALLKIASFLAMTKRIIVLTISHSYCFFHFRHCERSMSEAISYPVLSEIASLKKLAMTRCAFLFIAFLCLINGAFAQTYPFVNHTVEIGLSQAQVLCAFQDDEGVMWFGTNGGGITKFDGKHYEYIKDKDGLPDNVVYCIKKHPTDGSILIGTNNGLSVFKPNLWQHQKQKAFTNYTTEQGLTHNRIFTIVIDKQNRVLLGTGNGLSEYKNNKCKAINVNEEVNNAPIFHILQDNKNIFWYSTMGLGIFKQQGENIEHFNSQNGLTHDMVFATYEYQPNIYWFLTGEGVAKYNLITKKIEKESLLNEQLAYLSILKTNDNIIWLGTDNGIIKIEGLKKIKLFSKKNGLIDNSIWNILEDKEINKWFISNENGISKYTRSNFEFHSQKNGLIEGNINSIIQHNGVYYIGGTNGISIYKNNYFENIDTAKLKVQKHLLCFFKKKNKIFIGTLKGLGSFDNKLLNNKVYSINSESKLNVVRCFTSFKNKDYIGTEKALAYIDDNEIKQVKGFEKEKYIVYGLTKHQNSLFLSTDAGLIKYNGSQILPFTSKNGITEKTVRNCVEDKKGNLWIASNDGIYKYSQGKFTNISKQLNLPSKDIYSIAIDSTQNIWVGLSEGLGKIIPLANGSFKTKFYDKDNGFLGGVCSENAIYVDDKNHILVGTQDGLVIFKPEYDRDNTLEPFTKIRSIDLFSQQTDWSQHVDSISSNGLPYNLTLPYNKNYLTFNFVGVTQSTPNKVKYLYKVKGLDGYEDWQPTTKTEIAFDNLPFGEYEFMLKAENGEGVWNKEPLIYKFEITPPFWRTWWFYSIFAAIGLGFVYSYIQIRRAKNHISQQKEMIELKNEALNKANIEIADINKNITDSINYAKRIQNSFLTTKGLLRHILKEHFILFKPKDVVSGDFYWAFEFEDRIMVVCADCTGHGIPGAFMSLINISLLNEISHSKNILDPAKILEEIRRIIIQALNPYLQENGAKDGMDVTLISIFKPTNELDTSIKIHLSGGNNPLYIVPKNNPTEIVEYKVDKQPVGYYINMKPFTQQEIIAQKGDMLYLFTDGFPDQFGGDKGKKFMSKQLKKQLLEMSQKSCKEQNQLLENLLSNWQGKLEQVDDVTVIGIRL